MTLDIERMKKLGLKDLLEKKYANEREFQIVLAAKLRELNFKYFRGDLQDIIPDGPEVIALRTNLNNMGEMRNYDENQSRPGAWAIDLDLSLLAELLNVNFAVEMTDGKKQQTILSANPSKDKSTILVSNYYNTHWSAIINGEQKSTLGDGNCGYNAFALCLYQIAKESPGFFNSAAQRTADATAKIIHHAEKVQLKENIQEALEAEQQFKLAMENIKNEDADKFNKIQEQINSDYLFALKLAMADLPDEEGATNYCFSKLLTIKTDMKYVEAVADILKNQKLTIENGSSPIPSM